MHRIIAVIFLFVFLFSLGAQSKPREVRVNLTGYARVPQFTLAFSLGSRLLIDNKNYELKSCAVFPAKKSLTTDKGKSLAFRQILIQTGGETLLTTRAGTQGFIGRMEITATDEGILIINTLPERDYLASVLGGEMGEAFCDEALKAQAVAIRSYFYAKKLRNRGSAYDVCNTDGVDMVYRGKSFASKRMYDIIAETKDLYLVQADGSPAQALFHSTSGGWILKDEVFSSDYFKPPAEPALCLDVDENGRPLAASSPYFEFSVSFTSQELGRLLSPLVKISRINDIRLKYFKGTECVDFIGLADEAYNIHWLKGFEFVSAIQQAGILELGSIQFLVEKQGDSFQFRGRGFGHQCGMSQYSAEALGRRGMSFKDILARYYPQYRLVKIGNME
jgi:stage II sporulation protein D